MGASCKYPSRGSEKLTLEVATRTLTERLDHLGEEINALKNSGLQKVSDIIVDTDPSAVSRSDLDPTSHTKSNSEPSRDFMQIPSCKTSCDAVLEWEVFDGRYPASALVGALFLQESTAASSSPGTMPMPSSVDSANVPAAAVLQPLDDEQIPSLVDKFLQHVHTKNPVLDVELLVKHGRNCAKNGVGWDAMSCLVLLACALGSLGLPFGTSEAALQEAPRVIGDGLLGVAGDAAAEHARQWHKHLRQSESCFALACRRLGSLKHTLFGSQCYFFAGVYLMYTLKPIESWQYFFHASILYRMYIRTTYGIGNSDGYPELGGSPMSTHHMQGTHTKIRRLEQSLYWSCFKSESEFRIELPLPQSELSTFDFPNLFPSPPSPAPGDIREGACSEMYKSSSTGNIESHLSPNDHHVDNGGVRAPTQTDEQRELRQHAKQLCSEEESWYYYLTEIALRRIGNQIVNAFFRQHRSSWLNPKPLLRVAQLFEAQISSWSAHLPPAMQHYETTFMIRAPHLSAAGESASNNVSRELGWAVENRLLEMQTWLYQPFLYYLIHVGMEDHDAPERHHRYRPRWYSDSDYVIGPQTPSSLDNEDLTVLRSLVVSGIECNLKTLGVRTLRHRHHGLWFDLRSTMCASLILLAIVKSGNVSWIPGGTEALLGVTLGRDSSSDMFEPIGGEIAKVISQFNFWAVECPDLIQYRNLLEEAVRDTIALP